MDDERLAPQLPGVYLLQASQGMIFGEKAHERLLIHRHHDDLLRVEGQPDEPTSASCAGGQPPGARWASQVTVTINDRTCSATRVDDADGACLTVDSIQVEEDIYFEVGSAKLKPDAYIALGKIIEKLRAMRRPGMRITLCSSCDDNGNHNSKVARKLSIERANAIESEVMRAGFAVARVLPLGNNTALPGSSKESGIFRTVRVFVSFQERGAGQLN